MDSELRTEWRTRPKTEGNKVTPRASTRSRHAFPASRSTLIGSRSPQSQGHRNTTERALSRWAITTSVIHELAPTSVGTAEGSTG